MAFIYKKELLPVILLLLIRKEVDLKAILELILNYLIMIALVTPKTFISKELKNKKKLFCSNGNWDSEDIHINKNEIGVTIDKNAVKNHIILSLANMIIQLPFFCICSIKYSAYRYVFYSLRFL